MPRWPAGLHAASGSGVAYGYRPIRPPAGQQENYWRRMATELHAGANATLPAQGLLALGAPVFQLASVGPQGTGETWRVSLVQVQLPGDYGNPPLVTQQISAQAQAGITSPPPPVVAQVWLSAGGTLVHLLAQTTQGGNDTVDVGGQVVTVGESIAVQWWSTTDRGFPGFAWMALRGTRDTLSVQ